MPASHRSGRFTAGLRGKGRGKRHLRTLLVVGLVTLIGIPVGFLLLVVLAVAGPTATGGLLNEPSAYASSVIGSQEFQTFVDEGSVHDVPWQLLAGLAFAATEDGAKSPYDSVIRGLKHSGTRIWPTIYPPIGTTKSQSKGLYLLTPKIVSDEGKNFNPQSVTESTGLVASLLHTAAVAYATSQGEAASDYLNQSVSANEAAWDSILTSMPLFQGSSCASDYSGGPVSQIQSIVSCLGDSANLKITSEDGTELQGASSVSQLTIDAESLAWSFSQDGAKACVNSSSSPQGLLPLPKTSGVNRCDEDTDITTAIKDVIAAGGNWSVLPGALGPSPHTAPPPSYTPPSGCEDALQSLLGSLGSSNSPFKATAGESAAKAQKSYLASPIAHLRTNSDCGSPSKLSWETAVLGEMASAGLNPTSPDTAALYGVLQIDTMPPTATYGSTSSIARQASAPIDAFAPECDPSGSGCLPAAPSVASDSRVEEAVQYAIAFTEGGTEPSTGTTVGGTATIPTVTAPPPPAEMTALYQQAATICPGLWWGTLASIGTHETNNYADPSYDNGVGQPSGWQARGPMQMFPRTFAEYDYPATGDHTTGATTPTPPGAAGHPLSWYQGTAPYSHYYDSAAAGAELEVPASLFPPDITNPVNNVYAATRDLCANQQGGGPNSLATIEMYDCGDPGCSAYSGSFKAKLIAYAENEVGMAQSFMKNGDAAEQTSPGSGFGTGTATVSSAYGASSSALLLASSAESEVGVTDFFGSSAQLVAYLSTTAGVDLPPEMSTLEEKTTTIPLGSPVLPGDLAFFGQKGSSPTTVGIVVGGSSTSSASKALSVVVQSGTTVGELSFRPNAKGSQAGLGTLLAVTRPAPTVVTNWASTGGGSQSVALAGSTKAGQIAVQTAESYLGVPYVWGGASRQGVDCSGLTMLAWAAAGVQLEHAATEQWQVSKKVAINQLQPGDLLFYHFPNDGPWPITHVVMYVGSGPYGVNTIIQASEPGQPVAYAHIYWSGFVSAGRP